MRTELTELSTKQLKRLYRYNDLICKLEKIDMKAAEYLKNDAQRIPGFSYAGRLNHVFTWSRSIQGYQYWDKLMSIHTYVYSQNL